MDPAHPRQALADKLRHLISTCHPGDRGPYSYREIADGINQRCGERAISHVYIAQLCKGDRANPTVGHLELVADFFDVPVAYFFDDALADRINGEMEMIAAFRDPG